MPSLGGSLVLFVKMDCDVILPAQRKLGGPVNRPLAVHSAWKSALGYVDVLRGF